MKITRIQLRRLIKESTPVTVIAEMELREVLSAWRQDASVKVTDSDLSMLVDALRIGLGIQFERLRDEQSELGPR